MLPQKLGPALFAVQKTGSVLDNPSCSPNFLNCLQDGSATRGHIVNHKYLFAFQGFVRPKAFDNVLRSVLLGALAYERGSDRNALS